MLANFDNVKIQEPSMYNQALVSGNNTDILAASRTT
jgi:hypothetical protein